MWHIIRHGKFNGYWENNISSISLHAQPGSSEMGSGANNLSPPPLRKCQTEFVEKSTVFLFLFLLSVSFFGPLTVYLIFLDTPIWLDFQALWLLGWIRLWRNMIKTDQEEKLKKLHDISEVSRVVKPMVYIRLILIWKLWDKPIIRVLWNTLWIFNHRLTG